MGELSAVLEASRDLLLFAMLCFETLRTRIPVLVFPELSLVCMFIILNNGLELSINA